MTDTLMPNSATQLEKTIDLVTGLHIESIPIEFIFDQWHPQRCPADLLGWLAWAVSIDDWDASWPEQVKRDVIESSIETHRHKGTVGALKRTLSSFNIQLLLDEWFSFDGCPHTFRIQVKPESGISRTLLNEVLAACLNVKNARSHLETIRVSAPTQAAQVYFVVVASVGVSLHITNIQQFPQLARSLAGTNESEGVAVLSANYTLFARPETVAFAQRLVKSSGTPDVGAYDETLLDQPLGNSQLIGAFYLNDQFQFLLVWTLRQRLDTQAPATTLRDVFQRDGVSVDVAIYDDQGQLVAEDNTGNTEWVFSSNIGDLSSTYLSRDDGVWGVNLGGRVDGNAPGPRLGSTGWGANNYNSGDTSANALYINGVSHAGNVSAIICGGFQ